MSSAEKDLLRTAIRTVLQKRSVPSEPESILTAARQAHEDLASVMVPLIGDVGLRALSARAMHLAQRDFPADAPLAIPNDGSAGAMDAWLKQLEKSRAFDAAFALLSALGGLLGMLIGEALTMRLLRKAWADGFPDPEPEETQS